MLRGSSSLPSRGAPRCAPTAQTTKGTFSGPLFFRACPEGSERIQLAFLIRLLLRHWAQTRIRLGAPSTSTRTVCRLGYQRRLVRLLAWLTLLPVTGPLAHTAHTRAISSTLISCPTQRAGKRNDGGLMTQPRMVAHLA